jgi:molybdopterin-guanine dinucleotide biosynthesis protein A
MGRDKASLPFRGATLLEHVVARLSPPGAPVLVSTRGASAAVPPGATAVPDPEPGLGPLAGIAALLGAAPSEWVLVVPTDLPLLPPSCGDDLFAWSGSHDAVVVSSAGRVEPFPVLVRRALAPAVRDLLRAGERRADSFHAAGRTRVVGFDDVFPGVDPQVALLNVNLPADLARAEALLASGPP